MEQETIFPYMLAVAALVTLFLIGISVRAVLRRGEGEIGGWELRGARQRIVAVARATLAEGLRMKIAIVFIAFLAAAIPILTITAQGDGTIKGRVQMYLEYVLGLTAFVMALLTVVFSTRSLSSEIAARQIFGLVSKPIPRWQIIVGKWAGVTILNVAMLFAAAVITYGGMRVILWRFHNAMRNELVARGGLTPEQAGKCLDAINSVKGAGGQGADSPIIPAMADALGWTSDQVIQLLLALPETMRMDLRRLDELRRQVLVARASVTPPVPDFRRIAEARFKELKDARQLPDNMPEQKVLEELEKGYQEYDRAVPPRSGRIWTLKGPAPDAGEDFLASVQFKFEGYVNSAVSPEGRVLEENTIIGEWCLGEPDSPEAYYWPEQPGPMRLNQVEEFEVPTKAVRPDGTIKLAFANRDPRDVTAVFAAKNGLEVLYRAGSFEGNLLRAVLLLLCPLMFIAAVGVFFSTFCTFPVAAMVTLVLYAAGAAGTFLYDALGLTEDYFPPNPTTMDYLRKATGEAVLGAMSLGDIDATQRLIEGRLISWKDLGREAARSVLLKGGLFLLLGVVVFRRRELAAVIV